MRLHHASIVRQLPKDSLHITIIVIFTIYHIALAEDSDEENAHLCEKDMFDDNNYPISRGTSFTDLVELGNLFVDKSLLMKEVMECKEKVMLLVLPPAWGKSTNHEMMSMFFELQLDEEGRQLEPLKETRNHKFFKEGLIKSMYGSVIRFKTPPRISKEKDFFRKHQGKYPVIYVKMFRPYVVNAEGAINRVYKQISKSMLHHRYMMSVWSRIDLAHDKTEAEKSKAREDRERFNRLANFHETNITEMTKSLKFLSKILYEYHGQRVIILIDEYNHMLNHLERLWTDEHKFHSRNVGLEEQVLNFYHDLMTNTFEANEYLEKAIITGSMHVCGQRIFSGLTNFTQYDAINNRFDRFYGFTATEVEMLFERLKVPIDLTEKAINWYNGFRTNIHSDVVLYNPWDIAKFLEHQEILNFWENAVSKDSVRQLFNIAPLHRRFVLMARGTNITFEFRHLRFEKEDFVKIGKFYKLKRNDPMSEQDMDLICRRLYAAGYLTYTGTMKDPLKGVTHSQMGLANQEMRSEVARIMNLNIV